MTMNTEAEFETTVIDAGEGHAVIPAPLPVENMTALDFDVAENNICIDVYCGYDQHTPDHFRIYADTQDERELFGEIESIELVRPSNLEVENNED